MSRRTPLAAAALIVALLSGGGARAEEPLLWAPDGDYPGYKAAPQHDEPWHVFVEGGALYDSNLFRLPAGPSRERRSSVVYDAGGGGDADLKFGRQHFLVDAQADEYRFQHFSFLNYLGYDTGLEWKWLLGRLWSGDLFYRHRRYLTSFATLHQPLKDLIDEDHAYASARQDLLYNLRLTGAVEGYRYRHSAAERAVLDYRALSGIVWLQYISPAANSIGVQAKATRFRYPNQQVVQSQLYDNQYRIDQLSGTFNWRPGGASQVNGDVGYSRLRHHDISRRDFSGITYLLQYRWTPLGSTVFRFGGYRELRAYTDISASYIVVQGYASGMSWAPTYKTVLQLDVVYEDWYFRGDPGIVASIGPQRHDTIRTARISAGYMPLQRLRMDIAYEYGRRTSNQPMSGYRYGQIDGEIRLTF